jgi:anaphase-promoting complex subunit 6
MCCPLWLLLLPGFRAHKLVEEYPDSALAWFGVGCYYMASRQFEQSRCFFAKATQLDKHHAHSWICFGHAFAEQVRGQSPGAVCAQGAATPLTRAAEYISI